MRRRRERLLARWDRLTRESRHEGLVIRSRRRWYLLADRLERFAALWMIRWYRFAFRVIDRSGPVLDRFMILPRRLGRRLAGLRTRLADRRAARNGHGRATGGGTLIAAGLSLALAITVITLLPLDEGVAERTEASPTDRSQSPGPSSGPAREPETIPPSGSSVDLRTYTNEQAGYLFSYPDGWDVSTAGTATVLSHPDSQVVISFDTAPPGSLQRASDRVLEQLTAAYVAPKTVATAVDRTPQGYLSLAAGGTATDTSGAVIRFLVITIRGPDENRALSVRFPADTDPRNLDAVLDVVGSFRFGPAA
jgi:hypothetical protein